jgi:hypothetical protein
MGGGRELAGFIDQAGLFSTFGPVANKLHFSALPWWFLYLKGFLEQRGRDCNSSALLLPQRSIPHPEERPLGRVSKGVLRARSGLYGSRRRSAPPHHEE